MPDMARRPRKAATPTDVLHGALAGFVGGIVGTWGMAAANTLWNRAESALAPDSTDPRHRALRETHAGVGSGAHAQSEPRSHHRGGPMPSETAVEAIARAIGAPQPSPETREKLGSLFHFAFGAAAGTIYGALAARHPVVTAGHGTLYGTAVLALADEIGVPALGLAPGPTETPLHAHAYAWVGHLGYGVALETVRSLLAPRPR
jgi:uncharacterized membrane protein YagU involved in acid resistance